MAAKRKDDPRTRPVFRTDRMVKEGGKWFFYTREGTTEGPFDSEIEALNQLDRYIKAVNSGLLPDDEERLRMDRLRKLAV
jgi:hypothetical protein